MKLIETLEIRRMLSVYYVDPTAGNDSFDGTSATAAWQTLSKVNATDFLPGDQILLRGGAILDGTLTLGQGDAGDELNPLIVSSYGEGPATIDAGNADGIYVLNTAGIVISNLVIVGAGQSPATHDGIQFQNNLPDNKKLTHVVIDNVDVSGFGRYGIVIEGTGSSGKSGFNNVKISNVVASNNREAGIASLGVFSSTAQGYAHANVLVQNSVAHNNPGYAGSPNHSGNGIVMADIDGVTIERCVAYANGAENTHVGGPVGIWVWDVNAALIQYNESHSNRTNSTADGGGFDIDGGVTNSVMQYNYSHDNDGAGYGIYQFGGARAMTNNVVRYNISQNDARKNAYGAIDFWNGNGSNGIKGVEVHNNTVFVSPSAGATPKALRFISGTTDVHIRNNNFITTGGVMLADIQAKHTGLLIQGNNWYSSGSTFSLKYFAKVYSSLTAFRSGTGQERVGGQNVGLSTDPMLQAAGTGPTLGDANLLETGLDAYKLTSGSPMRDAGLNLSSLFGVNAGPRDLYGTALPPSNGQYDIGAHEYVSNLHDVAVTDIALPSAIVEGQSATVAVTVANQGTFAETFDVTLSATAGNVLPASQSVLLEPGQTQALSFTYDATTQGDQTLTAAIIGVSDDADPADNSRAASVSVEAVRHDLAVTAVTAPASATVGADVPVSVTVQNQGNQDEAVDLRLTSSDGTVVGTRTGLLAAGTSATYAFTWSTAGLPAASYSLSATVAVVTSETDTGDNAGSTSVTLVAPSTAPQIDGVTYNTSPIEPGQKYTMTVRGAGFASGLSLALVGGSGPTSSLSGITVSADGTTVTAILSVHHKAKSVAWDLLLTNPDGQSTIFSPALVVN